MTVSASPLNDAYQGGTFAIYTMKTYQKQPISFQDQLYTLQLRGLIIEDYLLAYNQLSKIGYFRLANYWHSMEEDKILHTFKPNSYFSNAVDLYYFDQELRSLLFSAIQSIEIAFRTNLMHKTAITYGSFWLLERKVFKNHDLHQKHLAKITEEVKRSKEDYIKEYFDNYASPDIPPVWKTMEVLSFGVISKLYENLSDIKLKKKIAKSFGLPQHKVLESWLKAICVLRNFIAHHARIWNRNYSLMPKLPHKLEFKWVSIEGISPTKLYGYVCCVAYLLDRVHPNNDFSEKLKSLLKRHPNVDIKALGFPLDWVQQHLWNKSSHP